MNTELLKLKIKALLHDPPEKALILMKTGEGHEVPAKKYIGKILGDEEREIPEEVRAADRIASACDRVNLPGDYKEYSVKFMDEPELRHPLSGKAIPLEKMGDIDLEEILKTVDSAIEEIQNSYTNQDETIRLKKLYLSLWRELPDLLKQKDAEAYKIGELWDLLPADTRIPDHSIWDHRAMVSALVGAQVKSDNASLFLFTLGPVQDFIAASRKTVDLWAGSYMLAWLSWKAMEQVCELLGPDAIIFPNLYKQPLVDLWLKHKYDLNFNIPNDFSINLEIPTLPNRFMAVVPDDHADSIGKEIETVVQDELKKVAAFVRKKNYFPQEPDWELWDEQVDNFLECYWTVLPVRYLKSDNKKDFDKQFEEVYGKELNWNSESLNSILKAYERNRYGINSGTVYGRLYSLLENTNGSAKALRTFRQVAEPGYRCSLIPSLAAMTPDKESWPADFNSYWQELARKNKEGLFKDSERLSAIAVIKRCFPAYLKVEIEKMAEDIDTQIKPTIVDHYPSTHSIAGADYKLNVVEQLQNGANADLREAVDNLVEAVDNYRSFLNNEMNITYAPDRTLYKIKKIAGNCDGEHKIPAANFCKLSGEFLFEEGFAMDKEKDRLSEVSKAIEDKYRRIQNEGIAALKKLYRGTGKLGIARPSKYYAVILFDGDHMGKWLSGEKAPFYRDAFHSTILEKLHKNELEGWNSILYDKDDNGKEVRVKRPLAPAIHAAISRALNTFSQKVRTIVEVEHLGKLIYAGGDDVLALVSLGDALSAAEKIRAAFSGHLDDNDAIDWTHQTGYNVKKKKGQPLKFLSMGDKASGSAGIGIVHYMYPLQQAMALTRAAEEYAKNELGRNAFALTAAKRSGDTTTTGLNWLMADEQTSFMPLLNRYIELLKEGFISNSFVFDLELAAAGLSGFNGNRQSSYKAHDAVLMEARRIYMRNSEKLRKKKDEETQKDTWENVLRPLFEQIELQKLIDLLSTVQFMIRGEAR